MTISKKRKLLITQLDEHLALLQKSVIALDYSYDKCRTIRLFPLNGLPPTISYDTLTLREQITHRAAEILGDLRKTLKREPKRLLKGMLTSNENKGAL